MCGIVRFAKSSIGAKVLMALTGVLLVGFVLAHLAGNLQIFLGPDVFNGYAAMLKGMPGLLWGMRIVLLAAVLLHIASGVRLQRLNMEARPQRYAVKATVQASVSSRTMVMSGLLLLAFIVYHLLHFTLGITDPEHFHLTDALGRHDAYAMFVLGFQQPLVAGSYMVAMLLLGLHLNHGVSSLFQSLGLNHPRYNGVMRKLGPTLALIVVVGNSVMPLACLLGLVGLPE